MGPVRREVLSELPDHPLESLRGVSEIGGPRRLLSIGRPRTANLAGRHGTFRGAGQPPKARGRKDVVGEVKGIEMMGVLVAGRGARERGGRRLEVEVNSKR